MTDKRFWHGFWRLADPKISLASFAGLWLGACAAAADNGLHWGWLGMTVLSVFCVEIAKNAFGEVVDYDSGTDQAVTQSERSPFSGGKRVLIDNLLDRSQALWISRVFYTTAIVIGLLMVWLRNPDILVFGLLGMALAWFYHGGSLRLSYRGLGEIAVAIAYGPLVVCGTYFVQTGHTSVALLHVACALGLHVAGFLWINEFPDLRADEASGKRNLVVKLGAQRAAFTYVLILGAAYCWLAIACFAYPDARGFLWGFSAIPLAVFSAWRLLNNYTDTPAIIPAQAACLGGFVLMAFGAGVGYLLS